MAKLSNRLKNPTAPLEKKRGPVWAGPESNSANGGVTFSLLSRFLVCRERFRLMVVDGLRPKEHFNSKIEYGSMWHEAEEAFAKGDNGNRSWADAGLQYARKLAERYPFDRDDIDHWLSKLYAQFPVYIEYWKQHPDVVNGEAIEQEERFCTPLILPSGRTIYLRGKRDRVDLIAAPDGKGIWLQENKTKSQIDQQKLSRQLGFDLQTMIYLVSLHEHDFSEDVSKPGGKLVVRKGLKHPYPIKGVRYNVIRRSAHKTAESMTKKMLEDIENNRGQEWFSRWSVEVTKSDIERFKHRCLFPILEQLCDWWEHIYNKEKGVCINPFDYAVAPRVLKPIHWQHPYGVYNVLDEGGSSELDAYINEGSEVGLTRSGELFPELQ